MTMKEYEIVCQKIGNIKGLVIDGRYFLDSPPDVQSSRIYLHDAIDALLDLERFIQFVTISDEHKYQIEEENKSEKEVA